VTEDEAREAMNSAIHQFIAVSDGFKEDSEILGDWAFIAHIVDINVPERSRYFTISNPDNLPHHSKIGLHNTALDVYSDQRWDHDEDEQ
jgi:hypothetical protein